jgi:hypothetical protein
MHGITDDCSWSVARMQRLVQGGGKTAAGYRRSPNSIRTRPEYSLRILNRPDFSVFLECHVVPHPFPSRLVPTRSVANSTRKDGGGSMDLIAAGIGLAICIGYIAWRY